SVLLREAAAVRETGEPGAMVVRRIRQRVGCAGKHRALGAGGAAEVVVEGMVFLDDDDDVPKRVLHFSKIGGAKAGLGGREHRLRRDRTHTRGPVTARDAGPPLTRDPGSP